jgi:hypothetical protein
MVRKTASFFEFSLCLSRACLGKMIVFIYKWLKSAVFRRVQGRRGVYYCGSYSTPGRRWTHCASIVNR